MAKVISLHNEVSLMTDLVKDTVTLIHHTEIVPAIKILINAHDILDLSLVISRQYLDSYPNIPWDKALFKDLNLIRLDLMTRFSDSFRPPTLVPAYYRKMGTLFSIMNLKLENT